MKVELTKDELGIINNALNELCNGTHWRRALVRSVGSASSRTRHIAGRCASSSARDPLSFRSDRCHVGHKLGLATRMLRRTGSGKHKHQRSGTQQLHGISQLTHSMRRPTLFVDQLDILFIERKQKAFTLSATGSSASKCNACIARSIIVGMPSGRFVLTSDFGM